MGDHPVIWTNEKMKARNVYFQMGHHANLFNSPDFKKMFANAILWAAVLLVISYCKISQASKIHIERLAKYKRFVL